ncbi:MAG: family 43 glycosylhydrolase [Chloroflexi bacterium]|nr:family 43 glycosylhydrolase [Chloroflexota bacterium]
MPVEEHRKISFNSEDAIALINLARELTVCEISYVRLFRYHGAVEAPFIIRKGDYYDLFAAFDFCYRGGQRLFTGRLAVKKRSPGPYVDHDGVDMLKGGDTRVTFPTERWRGPGHNAILQTDDADYIVYHACAADSLGAPTLR